MPTRKTKEEFIVDANKVHNGRYDYSKVEYVNNKTEVIIMCPVHGEFLQRPDMHIRGQGCPRCKPSQKTRKLVFGVGINDSNECVLNDDGTLKDSYRHWYNMLARCYSESVKKRSPQCKGCTVCEEWFRYSIFKAWYDINSVEGWALDKDILVKGNKCYSPQTCCFVPQEINSLFTRRSKCRGKCPIGVHYKKKGWKRKFVASLNVDGIHKSVGSFFTPEEAFEAYKIAKEAEIKKVANRYKETLEQRVYEALCNYKVEITD